jgi:hypothetical protein
VRNLTAADFDVIDVSAMRLNDNENSLAIR